VDPGREPSEAQAAEAERIEAQAAEAKQAKAPVEEEVPEKDEAPKKEKAASPPVSPAPSTRRRRAGARPPGAPPVVRARARYVRTSPRKARLMCEHIRGKPVPEARAILAFAPRAAARDWARLLDSAVANAENNHELVGDELRVTQAYADEGPTLKRFRPRAMGRATQIRKRTSHLTIALAPKESNS
jgi:ribosomal protein L22